MQRLLGLLCPEGPKTPSGKSARATRVLYPKKNTEYMQQHLTNYANVFAFDQIQSFSVPRTESITTSSAKLCSAAEN